MKKGTGRFIKRLLRLLPPAPGKRGAGRPTVERIGSPTVELPRIGSSVTPPLPVVTNGELLRPYVMTSEEWRERRLRRARRRTLWLATHGIDTGPRWIHSVEVPR
ncbi:hypothetical protein [Streptomyces sp. JJ38]|uniref:hypothetical protein n=1 Tax=Streptomyces sp. JJ38 TaxID=2738128 RepID=UPI001C580FC3|nr:hypothetical protein [Streptomyces sp. JJ38]MBW1596902.1 hypothetical protein [Streptomyces sp. JJ38]